MNRVVKMIVGNRDLREQIIAAAKAAGEPLTQQALNEWKKLRKGVPPGRARIVSHVTGLPLHKIRPDIFPPH